MDSTLDVCQFVLTIQLSSSLAIRPNVSHCVLLAPGAIQSPSYVCQIAIQALCFLTKTTHQVREYVFKTAVMLIGSGITQLGVVFRPVQPTNTARPTVNALVCAQEVDLVFLSVTENVLITVLKATGANLMPLFALILHHNAKQLTIAMLTITQELVFSLKAAHWAILLKTTHRCVSPLV